MMKKDFLRNSSIIAFFILTLAIIAEFIFVGFIFSTIFTLGIWIFLAFFIFIDTMYYRYEHTILKRFRLILIISFILFWISFILVEVLLSIELHSNIHMDEEIDYVIILGAGLDGDKVSKRLEGRLKEGLKYLKEKTDVKVIVSGGQGRDELISEAEAMGRYLNSRGINKDRIIYEDKSTSTIENMVFSKRIINTINNNEDIKVLIITSDYHMFRAKMICEDIGLECYGITSKSPTGKRVNYMIREYFATVKDWIYLNLQ
ncbi:YdcF family protein [Wukongibacter baidiensis]|uniref:YdcF family protein n=1 Tax=Wukongibacter baidiensis TaxID=1723361 RepID=UPI003D7F2FEC